jgi:hypothetical protein
MARAVLGFVWRYRASYPHAWRALMKSALVFLVALVRDTRTLRS